ncbi:MAG: hypothetical protein QOE28_2404 [Solirubrobacteraceae bacterium]|nr:hypothetical protein [Solirubrobacteraceae bacterium]
MKRTVWWPAALVTVVFGAAMVPALVTASSHGASVLSFEFAATSQRAHSIVSGWGHAGRMAARWQLVLDYGFIVGYATTLAVACSRRSKQLFARGSWPAAAVGTQLAWAAVLAGLADCVQNAALWLELDGRVVQPWPGVAFGCALVIAIAIVPACAFLAVTRKAASRLSRPAEAAA